jgi:hypothetical protein
VGKYQSVRVKAGSLRPGDVIQGLIGGPARVVAVEARGNVVAVTLEGRDGPLRVTYARSNTYRVERPVK